MPSALILIADGTEEIEFITAYDGIAASRGNRPAKLKLTSDPVLVRAGFTVASCGVDLKHGSYALCSRGAKINPDARSIENLAGAIHTDPTTDILVLPGGAAGAATFSGSETTTRLINRYREQGRWVACICAGTMALVKAAEKAKDESGSRTCRVTSHPSVKEEIVEKGWEYSEERVVLDGMVITSRGPGTALLFALTIVEALLGKAKRDEVAAPMIVAESL
ncbi:MAG: hypothetical protein M1816_006541 [Peltula sp. TS41687]|nr:MAG: hypothetical protein M1816_006541 [Peltula sp. TS41687]